ncbi:oxidoreductase [Massilia sp. Root351]|jgi:glycine/D-amino acid oxidase-like deaminating enzyme/nitrite reductase/ring-hydroxylating ferredoxin subunit|uniref:FAD-dependent oxidoreductase n=1 Tax=Massilia sp. Root351 TaxID=1736522 RepID=UPI0007094B27|nr:FAD-dependent oxidoreductase [Massilia sp. Root351]KQV82206.1 oxidoreductase [Massilia sp. Root351]
MTFTTNGRSSSVWMDDASELNYPPLPGDLDTDVCVIGAGIAGLTTAYLLMKEGKRVTVIDALGVGAGESGRTTAHFFPPDEWYAGIEEKFGARQSRLVADSYGRAIRLVEEIVAREAIECGFERLDGYLFNLPGGKEKDLAAEVQAAVRAGVQAGLGDRVPGLPFDTGPCVRYHAQAQFHPVQYLVGLAGCLARNGAGIYARTPALQVEQTDHGQRISTPHGRILAGVVVVATNTPFNNRVVMHTKQAGYRSYVIGALVPAGSVPRILLWDTGSPYHYIRLHSLWHRPSHELLLVGGADHKVGQDWHPEHCFAELEQWTRSRFPMALSVEYRWSGEVMEPADGLAFLGRNPLDSDSVYIITGDSGNGMTHTAIGAMIIRDMVMRRANPWIALYDPARKATHGLGEFAREQANTVSQYADWMKGGEVESAAEIPPGQGAIVRDGAAKLAVYRDDEGGLHAVSARCTHLGCQVHWNSVERSWDCPCHASRFATDGAVLHGPANTPLKAAQLPAIDDAAVRAAAGAASGIASGTLRK